jgi:hypothetical protein
MSDQKIVFYSHFLVQKETRFTLLRDCSVFCRLVVQNLKVIFAESGAM